jgi:hypothetical protein
MRNDIDARPLTRAEDIMDNEKPRQKKPLSRDELDEMQRQEQQQHQRKADEATFEIEKLDREKKP